MLARQPKNYNNGNGVFLRGPCRDVISKEQSQLIVQFCTGVGEESTRPGDRGTAIVGAVTRKRLVTD
jgi:hypothetical protein